MSHRGGLAYADYRPARGNSDSLTANAVTFELINFSVGNALLNLGGLAAGAVYLWSLHGD